MQTPNATVEVHKMNYNEVIEALEANPSNAELLAKKEALEEVMTNLVQTASGAKMVSQFDHIKALIDGAKSLDTMLEEVIYFLTDCESSTINDYKAFKISENRNLEEVKMLELMSKKQVFKMLVDEVASEVRKHLEGANLFDKGAMTGLLKPIHLIVDNYKWIIDLHFNDSIDQPKHRLELIKQIARIFTLDNHSKELKVYSLAKFKADKVKEPILSKSDIKALNTQKTQRGSGTYFTYSASSLAQHLKDLVDAEVKLLKEEEENTRKAQNAKIAESIRAKAIEDYVKAQKESQEDSKTA